jgi:hypothetical protein
MDEEVERLLVSVRADTAGFARDVAEMRGQLDGPLTAGAERAGRRAGRGAAEGCADRILRFEDLKRVALSVMSEIAAAAVRGGGGGGSGGGNGLAAIASALITSLAGAPGRATAGRWRRGGPTGSASAGRNGSCRQRAGEWRPAALPAAQGRFA